MIRLELDWSDWDGPQKLIRRLREAGHEAWLAGGCVRDLLLGVSPKDYDVATSADPAEVMALFPKAIPLKPELGVVLVPKGKPIEVTSFRSEGPYLDGRRPAWVKRTSAEGDVQRRDFTINGLLLDPETGEVVDMVGGVDDLRAGRLRCIRDPHERFSEDHLRLLRAVRFSTRLGFAIDPETWTAARELSGSVVSLSGERVHEELGRMFGQGPFLPSLVLLRDMGVLAALFPELSAALEDPVAWKRTERLLAAPWPGAIPWVAGLFLPLCPWFSEMSLSDGVGSEVADSYCGRLRVSNGERDAAHLAWTRFPELFQARERLSDKAGLVRERHFAALLALLEIWPDAPSGLLPSWLDDARRVAGAPRPPTGQVWMAADPRLRGRLVGEAIRRADAILLDEGPREMQVLVKQVVGTMFEDG
jgi:tRNA nucleotidyltransferase/poly(A) polymerase